MKKKKETVNLPNCPQFEDTREMMQMLSQLSTEDKLQVKGVIIGLSLANTTKATI